MHLVLGLGNPGKQFVNTRHNFGFLVLDSVRERLHLPAFSQNASLHTCITQSGGIVLAKPTTFMNESGRSLDGLRRRYTLEERNIIIVHDDLDIQFGNIKLYKSASTAGHNGIESVARVVNLANIVRVRLGIANETRGEIPGERYVLSPFTKKETTELPEILIRATKAVIALLEHGYENAAQEYNRKQRE